MGEQSGEPEPPITRVFKSQFFGGGPVTAAVIWQWFNASLQLSELRMNNSSSSESSPSRLAAKSWLPADFVVIGLWLHLPIAVYLWRKIVLTGARDYFVELSSWAHVLLGMSSFVTVSVLAVGVLLGVMKLRGSKTRRVFIYFALIAGVLVELVYLVSCFGSMMVTLHRLG